MELLPDRIEDGGLVLRAWREDDGEALREVVEGNLEHLGPWMEWVAGRPLTAEGWSSRFRTWRSEWEQGGDSYLGAFISEGIVGAGAMHRRASPDVLEIGYWVRAARLREGIATRIASALATSALEVPGIRAVEIHHDKANEASAAIPAALGFQLVSEAPDRKAAPAELGIELIWRLEAPDRQ